jgi:uncharacterized protein with HEPN domain
MRKDSRLYLDDIPDAITQIQEYTSGIDYAKFTHDRKTQDAVVRNLEIIGEAANRLPEFIKAGVADIEWRKIIGLRNILAHEYYGVSLPVVWDIVQNKIGPLEIASRKLLASYSPLIEKRR